MSTIALKLVYAKGAPAKERMFIANELLLPNKTINSDFYYQQPTRFKQEVEKKRQELINRRGVVFHQDNIKPHTYLATQQILREYCWKMLMHPL
ncbi:hypothetical protein EVAR_95306_1 [Eumeta japonica]|uniref:Histone-lysine N-methyltransferase SETMAR n=1 Tax=Eumeta variegata TaxID=151549 RepID=A0A4C1UAI9_EUMVA|nr:hypothetical protein EVAR_95306_1 [Eumeta japonica]